MSSTDFPAYGEKFLKLAWSDYAAFALMFSLSILIGIYYGCFKNKPTTIKDYFLGGKNMKILPVAASLITSTLSGISLLGHPAEVYVHGSQYSVSALAIIVVALFLNYVYLPVFYNLQVTSTYEYLERRFSRRVRLISSLLYVITSLLTMSMILYLPILAFNQVTGIDIKIITPFIGFACIFYTAIGGLKGIVWADTLQFLVIAATLIFILVMGTKSAGGLSEVWKKAASGKRLEFFNMNLDPTARQSFWHIMIGYSVSVIAYFGCNAATVQRFISLPSLRDARWVLFLYALGSMLTYWITCFFGLIVYAKYFDCDPLTTGQITKADQILPYYVLDMANSIPGLSGLFIAAIFGTTFSTLSTFLNTVAGVVYTDFVQDLLSTNIKQVQASGVMRSLVVLAGTICIGLVFIVNKMGTVLELSLSIVSITLGPLCGLFTMGMIFPSINEMGAICGTLSSFVVGGWVIIKSQLYEYHSASAFDKPLYTYGCGFNTTTVLPGTKEAPLWLYRISFYYHTLMSIVLAIIIAFPVSWATNKQSGRKLDPNLLCSFSRRWLPNSGWAVNYATVEKSADVRVCNVD